MPIADLVSGRVWLSLKRLDPIHATNQYREFTQQAAGGGPVRIPFREPTPRFSRNIIVSHNVGRYPYQTEPCIAVNPTDPDNLIIGLDDYNFFGDAIYVSIDGGVTWEGPIALKVLMRDQIGGNPTLSFSRNGEAYFAQMSIGYRWVRVPPNLVVLAEVASIPVYKSTDGGLTWSDPRIAAQGTADASPEALSLTFLDRPWITVGPDPKDPGRDNIYVTYTEFTLNYPILEEYPYLGAPMVAITIKLVRSTDGGSTFSDPVAVTPTYTYLVGEEYRRIVQGSQSAVATDGTLYVAFYDSLDDGPWEGLFAPTVTWSTDGGLSF
ncbi:TPA: exo-alpha-sialidase, partial [Candidatus Bathyarchaeota archaeon]|nr:exo-alpha-sialidase [Candidatus Bathyarchaeota archaeon]